MTTSGPLYGHDCTQREVILRQFENAWKSGSRPSLAQHLKLAQGEKKSLLVELVFLDLEYRLKAGESARVEDYLEHAPQLAQDQTTLVELVTFEFDLRRRNGGAVSTDEYLQRFSELGQPLANQLADIASPTNVQHAATIVVPGTEQEYKAVSKPASPSATSGSTSSRLLEQVKLKDADAWRHLVRLYGPLVFHWCSRFGLQNEDAADVSQEVFRAVAGAIDQFRHDRPGDTFRGWLLTITRNKVRDFARRQSQHPAAVGGSFLHDVVAQLPADDDEPAAANEDRDAQGILVRRALEMIGAEFEQRTWQAFWRTAVEQQPTRDVAEDLGMSQTAVRIAKSRVRRRLRDALADPLEFDG